VQNVKVKNSTTLIFRNSIILAVAFIVAKILGAFYRIPLTTILTTQGMGIYQMVFPMYAFTQVMLTSGISVATTKLVAKGSASGFDCKKVFVAAVKLSFYLALTLAGFMSLAGTFVSKYQQLKLGSYLYFVLSACLVASGIASTIKAYFQGKENMMPTAISTLCEQVAKLMFGLILSKVLFKFGVECGVLGAFIGVFVGELIVLCVTAIFFKKQKTSCFNGGGECAEKLLIEAIDLKDNEPNFTKNPTKQIIKIALPVVFASSIIPLMFFIDSLLIVKLLTNTGVKLTRATSDYGVLYGVINSLINMPTVFASAVSLSLLPNLTKDKSENKSNKAKLALIVATQISLIFVALFLFFPSNVLSFLYRGVVTDLSINLLRLSSVLVLMLSLSLVLVSVFQSIGKLWENFFVFLACVILKYIALLILVLTKHFDIYVACCLNIGFYSLSVIINLIRFYFNLKPKFSIKNLSLLLIMAATILSVNFMLNKFLHFSAFLNLMFSGLCSVFIFVVFCYFMFKKLLTGKNLNNLKLKKERDNE